MRKNHSFGALVIVAFSIVLGLGQGCSTAAQHRKWHDQIFMLAENGNTQGAISAFELAKEEAKKKNRLLYLMNLGMLEHADGRYEKSAVTLEQAVKMAEELDYFSVSEGVGTFLTDERNSDYRGERFERVLLPTIQAINFLMMGDKDGARVEAKRIDEWLKLYGKSKKATKKGGIEQMVASRYIAGLVHEWDGKPDDAFIDYYKAHQVSRLPNEVAGALLSLGKRRNRLELKELMEAYPDVPPRTLGTGQGELVVLIEYGRAPRKQSVSSTRFETTIPEFYSVRPLQSSTEVLVDDDSIGSVLLTDLEAVAVSDLESRIAGIMVKRLASTGLKAAMADSDEASVALIGLVGLLAEGVDTRSWSTLPGQLRMVRTVLPVGEHTLKCVEAGNEISVVILPRSVQVAHCRIY